MQKQLGLKSQGDDRGGLACTAGSADGVSHAPPKTGGTALRLREVLDGPLRHSRELRCLPHPQNRDGKSTHGLHDEQLCRLPACAMQKQTVIARCRKLGLVLCWVYKLQLYSLLGLEPETKKLT